MIAIFMLSHISMFSKRALWQLGQARTASSAVNSGPVSSSIQVRERIYSGVLGSGAGRSTLTLFGLGSTVETTAQSPGWNGLRQYGQRIFVNGLMNGIIN